MPAFQQGNLLVCTWNKEHLRGELFVYVLNSCGLLKVVKKKHCQISRTQEQIKPVKDKLSRKTCSPYRCVSKLVKKLVKENLLVCTGLNISFTAARNLPCCYFQSFVTLYLKILGRSSCSISVNIFPRLATKCK